VFRGRGCHDFGGEHVSVMPRHHAWAMGRSADHNIVCDLVGEKMIPIEFGYHDTILDLGAWSALYTESWGRCQADQAHDQLRADLPPRSRDLAQILSVAARVAQAPPQRFVSK
jgi:NADH:ubiquinone reductase (H+-translocating)